MVAESNVSEQELRSIIQEVVKTVLQKLREEESGIYANRRDKGTQEQSIRPVGGIREEERSGLVASTVIPAPPPAVMSVCTASSSNCNSCGVCVLRRNEDAEKMIALGAARLGFAGMGTKFSCRNLAPYIDHTLLKPDARDEDIIKLCKEAIEYGFAAVCINSAFVPLAASILKGTPVKVATVVGFPLGSMSTEAKAFETRDAVAKGADEIDMVIAIGKLKSGDYHYVYNDIHTVVKAAQGRVVKVIIEAAMLTEEEKIAACILAKAAGAHYVKTSTGFGPGGATAEDVALMRAVVGPKMGVKAAGGIRDCKKAVEMLQAGATRIGASASVAIVNPES